MERLRFGSSGMLPAVLGISLLAFTNDSVHAQTGAIGANFTTMTLSQSQGSPFFGGFIPPDTMGSVGTSNFIEFTNGSMVIYNKLGASISSIGDETFWTNHGITGLASAGISDPRILYDPTSQKWYCCQISTENTNNRILIARSNNATPTNFSTDWSAVQLPINLASKFADYPTMAVDANGIYIGTNDFGGTTTQSLYSIPKSGIAAAVPTVANATKIQNQSAGTFGFTQQAAVNFGPKLTNQATWVLATDSPSGTSTALRRSQVSNVTGPGAAAWTSLSPIAVNSYGQPSALTSPGGALLDSLGTRIVGNVMEVANPNDSSQTLLYSAFSVANASGRPQVRWTAYNTTTGVVRQGNIADTSPSQNLGFNIPTIAANPSGDVVMAFTGANSSTSASVFAAVGSTDGSGNITFGSPFLVKAGTGNYNLGSGTQRWGDYSVVNVDPTDPGIFWIHQEFVASTNNWGTQASEIVPTKAGQVRWGVANNNSAAPSGSFTDSTKYLTGVAPAPTDHVIFSRGNSTYTVSGLSGQTSDRATVRQGTVTWDMGGGIYTLTNVGATTPSLGVSDFQGTSSLTINNGTVLSVNATIGAGFGGNGTVNVGGASAANWNHAGTVYVGGDSTGPKGGVGNLVVNSGSSLSNPVGVVQVHPGGTVSGTGTIAGSVNVTGGATTVYHDGSTVGTNRLAVNSVTVGPAKIAPGNLTTTVGTLSTGPLSITSGGAYNWKVSAVGTAGVSLNTGGSDVGAAKDLINIAGAVTFNNPEIDIVGLGSHGFNNAQSYSWTIATFSGVGTLSGTPTFVLNNISPAAGSQFSLGVGTGAVFLNYSPVPEPATILAACAAAGGFWSVWRRRRSRQSSLTA